MFCRGPHQVLKRATPALWPVVIVVLSFPSRASCCNSLCNASGRCTFVSGGMIVTNYFLYNGGVPSTSLYSVE
jgi:hypothetical protein